MEVEKRRRFIINFLYVAILALLAFAVIRFGLPMLAPFVAAFLIAYLLNRPIGYFARKLKVNRKPVAILMVLLFYGVIGLLLALLGVKLVTSAKSLVFNLPSIYAAHVEPGLMEMFNSIEQSALRMDPALMTALEEMFGQFVQSLGQMVSGLSVSAVGALSGYASSLPGFFIKLLLAIISSFFIAADYDHLTGFILRQFSGKTRELLFQIKEYAVGTLFVCIRSYILIMSITFVELSIGLSLIGVNNAIPVALLISIFDILPVLGTGGVMIPWTLITALQGNYPMALGLLAIYLIITIIRNILEPKIVGSQLGLHPVVTLASMFVGAKLFGILGLFGFPITLSLLRHLNDTGVIKLFK